MIRTSATLLLAFTIYAVLACGQPASPQLTAEADVLKVEDSFRVAKLQNDVEALRQILDEDFVGVNQYGTVRNKGEVLELFRTFKISELSRAEASVRFSGDVAVVFGAQTEVNPAGKEKLQFTRVYVKRGGRWRLLCTTQLIPFNY